MKAYILIETEMGQANPVARAIPGTIGTETTLLTVDPVTGPFDIIVVVEGPDLQTIVSAATDRIQKLDGVRRTTTCIS